LVLSVTDRAADMINELTERAGLPPGSGLRIARRPEGYGLAMSLASQPSPGDSVVVVEDTVLYLDAPAADRLRGQTLDARANAQGAAFFL
jgi:Fe-S cluster assembly iron-binding protein IscA